MNWQQMDSVSKEILMNFCEMVKECVRHTSPDEKYFARDEAGDFYYATQVPFPLMNGIVCFSSDPSIIEKYCAALKKQFADAHFPITYFWPHDVDLPETVAKIFSKNQFKNMGVYTSVAVERNAALQGNNHTNPTIRIQLIENDQQLMHFLEINKTVYGIPELAMPSMERVYRAYRHSPHLKLYLAYVDNNPVATLLAFQHRNTLGLYNGATLESYRKKGALTSLILNAIHEFPKANYIVAQLMAAQNAKGVCDKLGFKEYAHFIPLCYGFDVSTVHA